MSNPNVSMPVPRAEAYPMSNLRLLAPHASHYFTSGSGDERCCFCDCRPYGKWGHLPCGAGLYTLEGRLWD